MAEVGFIGLGIMGRPMAKNLLRAGHEVVVYDIVDGPVDDLVESGALAAKSCADVAAASEIIITMLPDGPEVEAAVLGPEGVLKGAWEGALLIDMSSVNPSVSRKISDACVSKGVEFIDAPVSGGEPKAKDGTLALMVGGPVQSFERAKPILEVMGSSVVWTGGVGAGNVTKLANQIMVACNIAAIGEALVLATKAGVDPEVVFNAVKGGLAGSTVLNAKGPMMLARNFKPGFRIRLHHKDLRNALEAAEAMDVALPLTTVAQQMLVSLMEDGRGDLDHSALVNYIEERAGIEVAAGQLKVSHV
jgi:2-hydroxy-3-oxopropionate reductase